MQSEKDFLLSQIADVLSNLQSLVSQLSTVQIQEDERPDENSKVKLLCQNIVAPSLKVMSNDLLHTFAYDCDVSSTSDEEDASSVTSQSSQYCLLSCWDITEDYPVQPVSDSQNEIIKFIPQECSFVNKMKTYVSFFDNVYTEEKSSQLKQKILDENVFPEFQSMWRHSIVGDLFIQNPDSAQISTTTSPTPEIVFETIDFSRVNVRNMANIPKPASCPVHGCSEDPKFYSEIVKLDSVDYYGRHYTSPCRHQTSAPFGSLFGYQTDDGIVPVPDTPVHGHVWSDQLRDWVLHAVFPDDCSPAPAPWRGTRSPTTRPPSTRRGWSTSRPRREGKG